MAAAVGEHEKWRDLCSAWLCKCKSNAYTGYTPDHDRIWISRNISAAKWVSTGKLAGTDEYGSISWHAWEYVFQTESPGGEDEEQWVQQLDAQIAAWNGAGIGTPGGYFFSEGQSSESKEEDLKARGFSVWAVPQQSGGYIGNLEDGVLPVKTVVVSKHAMTMESALTNAISKKKSVAFLFPEVTSQIEGDGEAITPETFRKLLSEIKEKIPFLIKL